MESVYLNGGMIGATLDFADTVRYSTGTALSVNYITLVQENAPAATSHTFSGVSTTGLTSSDTIIVIFHSEVTAHTAGNPVTSVTINGSSATIDFQTPTTTITGNIGIAAVARISGITASSVNITVNYPNQNILRAAVSTYIVPGVTSLTVLDTDEFGFVGSSSSQTLATNVENGGLVIYGLSLGDENDTTVWSDATENYDVAASENNAQWAGAYYLPTVTESHVESLTISGATNNGVGLAVSYESNIVVGNLKNSGIWLLQSVIDTLIPPTVEFIGVTDIGTDGTTFAFNGVSIGSESDDRLVVVVIETTGTTSGATKTALTLNGNAMTDVHNVVNGFGNQNVAYYRLTSGTTADVSITYSGTKNRSSCAIYTVKGQSSDIPLDTDYQTTASLTVDLPKGSAGLFTFGATGTNVTTTWSGATEDLDQAVGGEGTTSISTARELNQTLGYTVTATHSATPGSPVYTATVWS